MDRISDEFSNSIGFVYRINKLNRNVFKFNFAKKYTHSDNKVYLSNPNIVNNATVIIVTKIIVNLFNFI